MKRVFLIALSILVWPAWAGAMGLQFSQSASGNWNSAATWLLGAYTGSGGSASTYPGQSENDDVITALSSGGTVTLNGNYTIATLSNSTNGYVNNPSGSSTLTFTNTTGSSISYSGNNTTHGCFYNTAGTTTLSNTNSGVTLVNASSSGYGTYGIAGVTNVLCPSGTAASETSTSNALYYIFHSGTVTGALSVGPGASTAARALNVGGASCKVSYAGLPIFAATGQFFSTGPSPLLVSAGSVNWTGAQSASSGQQVLAAMSGGTLDCGGLNLSNSGQVLILGCSGANFNQDGGTLSCSGSNAGICGFNLFNAGSPVSLGVTYPGAGGTALTVSPSSVLAGTNFSSGSGTLAGAMTLTNSSLLSVSGTGSGATSNGTLESGVLILSGSQVAGGVTYSTNLTGGTASGTCSVLSMSASDVGYGKTFSTTITGGTNSGTLPYPGPYGFAGVETLSVLAVSSTAVFFGGQFLAIVLGGVCSALATFWIFERMRKKEQRKQRDRKKKKDAAKDASLMEASSRQALRIGHTAEQQETRIAINCGEHAQRTEKLHRLFSSNLNG